MTDEAQGQGEATLFPKTVGERLRDARVAQKLELSDIAQRTRVPLRHLQAIEDGDYSGLPTATYAVGFARAYARAVGEDEVEIAREVRGKSEAIVARRPEYTPYNIDEAPRTPSRGILWLTILAALAVAIGAFVWYNWPSGGGTSGGDAPVAASSPTAAPTAAAPTPAAVTNGQVTLVATDEVWVRIYDANDSTLKMGTMTAGERYDVPHDAAGPMINVGRPDKLQILVNGSQVAPLGDGKRAIKDVAISAAALAARNLPAPAAGASPAPAAASTAAPTAAGPNQASPNPGGSVPPFFQPGAAPTNPPAGTGR